jgi:hypothetical protein
LDLFETKFLQGLLEKLADVSVSQWDGKGANGLDMAAIAGINTSRKFAPET